MKFSIKKELLLENLNNVSKAVSSKNVIPVLGGIKFNLTNEGLFLTATNNEIDIESFIDKKYIDKIESLGTIVIQGKYLLEIVRKLPEGLINIEIIDGLKILINSQNSNFNLNGIDPNEFPNINLENSINPIILSKKVIKNFVNQTLFATSMQESRPILTGINIKITGDILECSATDSYRLAKKQAKLNEIAGETYNIIVPGKNIVEFMKILNEGNEELEIHIFSNKVLFKQNNLLFQSRLVSGNYPNVNNLIPSDSFLKITANLSNLYDVIDRASILTSDKEKNIVTLETNKNLLIVRSSSAEIGRVEEKMNITKDNEEEIKISFSAKYMMDALRSFEGDTVELAFEGEVKPIIIKDVEDPNLTQLVLPIRTY